MKWKTKTYPHGALDLDNSIMYTCMHHIHYYLHIFDTKIILYSCDNEEILYVHIQ